MLNDKQVQALFESAIALVEHDGYKVPAELNRKAGYNRCKTSYGYCKSHVRGNELLSAEISFSKYFVQGATEQQLFNVAVHEVLHSVFPRDGHKGGWKKAAERITAMHDGLNITRCENICNEDGKEILSACSPERKQHITYVVSCTDCGKQWVFHRANKYTKETNRFSCACGCRKLICTVNHD